MTIDLRNLKVFADTPEERAHAQWLVNDGQSLGGPLMPMMDRAYSVSADASGGPGSSVAYATATQTSFIGADSFSGSLTASAQARATPSTVSWGYYGHGSAFSLFDVQFQLDESQPYSFTASGSGNVSASLGQVGGSMLWSSTGFHSGQLAPGLYEFRFAVSADALAPYSALATIAGDNASGQFTFGIGVASVPDDGVTWLMLALACAVLRTIYENRNPNTKRIL